MCIAVVATVLELLEGGRARAACMGNFLEIEVGLVDAKPGDQVLVHAGCAIQLVSPQEARDIELLFHEIQEAADER